MTIPDSFNVEGKEHKLQAAGVRKATIFRIKVFTLAFYNSTQSFIDKPFCFEFTYFRDFSNSQVDDAWDFQFKESNEYTYPELGSDLSRLKDLLGEIKGERKQTFIFSGNVLKVYENGQLKGEIQGDNFQKSFISLWIGEKSPVDQFKAELKK
jgi:hypothetical protein